MAVSFRHGGNGSYKSAYAVWFEILPALRAGRLVVTNIEGLKSLESIEKLLDEKFPSSAKLIRIFSRSVEGVELWQNWFSWMPIGALVVIDECQDLYTKKVGFNMDKMLYKPLDSFLENLPKDFEEYFYSRWQPQDPTKFDDGDIDDTGRTQLDESNRLLYPFNFYGAFMRHRKYQWDIVMLTPDWTAIDTSLRGCAQSAYGHRSTDTFFRKRRPRIFSHLPNTTTTKPTKSDAASVTSIKIPLEVFALYKSTGTGGFNSSMADLTMLKSPKLLLALVVLMVSFSYFGWSFYNVFFSDDEIAVEETVKNAQSSGVSKVGDQTGKDDLSTADKTISENLVGVDTGDGGDEINSISIHPINAFAARFPNFNTAVAVYVSSVNRVFSDAGNRVDYLFRFDMGTHSEYLSSSVLGQLGYEFDPLDDCVVSVTYGAASQLVVCAPLVPDKLLVEPAKISSTALPSFSALTSS